MKFTQILCKQNTGRMIAFLWQRQRKRTMLISNAEKMVKSMGYEVKDASEVADPPKQFEKIDLPPRSNVDPDWKERSCLTYKDYNVLQEGVPQACLLTKTLKIDDELPTKIQDLITDIPEHIDNLVKRIVLTSTVLDAQQVKLPKLKDPERPRWVFPRLYGISSTRKMHNISYKFLQLCESLCGLNVAQTRTVVRDGILSTCIEKESYFINLCLKMDLITSLMPLTSIADVNESMKHDLPDLFPLHFALGLVKTNIYKTDNIYPIAANSAMQNIHTIFVNHDPEEVKNITGLPVTEDQIQARSLMESFTAATVYARQRFGLNVKELSEPVVVQCIQSDGQKYHFSVYQLNTLDLDGKEGIKNFWWSTPIYKLYEEAKYKDGKPYIKEYNNEIFKRFFAFYKNK
nr:39S ribosomal protein L37, mitochondrial [Megalopta genalis]XP_033325821.1 39S ribosomal protein L37, mitochondrial [Megalopta genalis]XP_033325822.1 39S ribosomal protein L37, mitochondrial [Megalopta genalis]